MWYKVSKKFGTFDLRREEERSTSSYRSKSACLTSIMLHIFTQMVRLTTLPEGKKKKAQAMKMMFVSYKKISRNRANESDTSLLKIKE